MSNLVELIVAGDRLAALEQLHETIISIAREQLNEFKIQIAQNLDELNRTHQGRVDLVNVRVKDGKVIRRSRIRNRTRGKGWTTERGHIRKMSGQEHAKRKAGQRIAKIKRKSEMNRILRKRYKSLKVRYNSGGP